MKNIINDFFENIEFRYELLGLLSFINLLVLILCSVN